MARTALLGGVVLIVLGGLLSPALADGNAPPQGGVVTGVLTAKGPTWIEVKADGETEAQRYLPFWHDGGFDKQMLETIGKLVVPNRVKLTWQMQEHRRIVSVEMLRPADKSGTVTGTVTAKGETWIEVKADGGAVERYWPRWIGGNPNQGGGFDKDMVRTLAGLKVGDHVSLKWTYDERKRVIEIHVVAAAGT